MEIKPTCHADEKSVRESGALANEIRPVSRHGLKFIVTLDDCFAAKGAQHLLLLRVKGIVFQS
ncbi:hypothetical protein R0J93_27400, partial [Pseudoalteromonas sp. SIMBA_148]